MSRLLLAPMEGVVDWVMRDMLTEIGGVDQCVTEFLRVTSYTHSDEIFFKNCPELLTRSRTRTGTPVFVQLLGGQVEPMAANAKRAAELGALGIDLNFGCPAKTVNRHDGGASLLKNPQRIYDIIKAVRTATPQGTPVTAKIRLGFDDPTICFENALAAEEAGANWLTVHCRTKTDGYKPPAYWEWLPRLKEKTNIHLIANGEIWNVSDYLRCKNVSGCTDFMIGRGAVANPYLFKQIKNAKDEQVDAIEPWEQTKKLLPGFYLASQQHVSELYAVSRTKQWLKALALQHPEAKEIFENIKVYMKPAEFLPALKKNI